MVIASVLILMKIIEEYNDDDAQPSLAPPENLFGVLLFTLVSIVINIEIK